MQNVLEYLRRICKKIDLSVRFDWNFNGEFLNRIPQVGPSINAIRNHFERNVLLKEKLTEYFSHNDPDFYELYFWIVNEFGQIKGFKDTTKNRSKIHRFRNEIEARKLTRNTFSTISSLSKISSFRDCRKYAIYYSIVIHSLNWLILKYAKDKLYFPTPPGKNTIVAKHNIDTIIFFSNQNINANNLYYSYKDAYHRYCQLLLDWSLEIWDPVYSNRRHYPFYLEMILFVIADRAICEDMRNSVTISIR